MTDPILQQIIDKTHTALNGGFGVLSAGEKLAAALCSTVTTGSPT